MSIKKYIIAPISYELRNRIEDNKKKIWKLIQKTGDELIGRLPDHPSHPKGRNPYAHIALEIKNHFGMSYKDIEDDKIPELEKFIEFIQNNPR